MHETEFSLLMYIQWPDLYISVLLYSHISALNINVISFSTDTSLNLKKPAHVRIHIVKALKSVTFEFSPFKMVIHRQ